MVIKYERYIVRLLSLWFEGNCEKCLIFGLKFKNINVGKKVYVIVFSGEEGNVKE